MSAADKVLISKAEKMRKFVRNTSDDVKFAEQLREWREYNVSYNDLSHISGVGQQHITHKDRAAGIVLGRKIGNPSPYENTPSKDYIGKRLDADAYVDQHANSDWQDWWARNCPPEFAVKVFREHIDSARGREPAPQAAQMSPAGFVQALFRFSLNRDGQAAGVKFWTGVLEKYNEDGKGRAIHRFVKSFTETDDYKAERDKWEK